MDLKSAEKIALTIREENMKKTILEQKQFSQKTQFFFAEKSWFSCNKNITVRKDFLEKSSRMVLLIFFADVKSTMVPVDFYFHFKVPEILAV